MKDKVSYADLAIGAMRRAAKAAHQQAADNNLKVPIYQDGQVVHIDAKELVIQDNDSTQSESSSSA